MSTALLSLLPAGLAVDRVTVDGDHVVVAAHVRAATAACPLCRRTSRQVHSRYIRRLGDLPWQGRVGQLHLHTRRFRCATAGCPRRIFAERLPTIAMPRVRRTRRLAEAQRTIALRAGGEPGARLATRLAMPVSGDTLLRLIRAVPVPERPTPRVIGIDDWAWRRGKRYGTIIVDLERNRPIDLLPDRQADTVATWLKAHPGVEIVAQDRAGAYADGIRQGAPDAIQVTDRWHLLRNLGDALGEVLTGHQRDLRTAAQRAVAPAAADTPAAPPVPKARPATRAERRRAATRAARLARYEEVAALNARGWSQTRIALKFPQIGRVKNPQMVGLVKGCSLGWPPSLLVDAPGFVPAASSDGNTPVRARPLRSRMVTTHRRLPVWLMASRRFLRSVLRFSRRTWPPK